MIAVIFEKISKVEVTSSTHVIKCIIMSYINKYMIMYMSHIECIMAYIHHTHTTNIECIMSCFHHAYITSHITHHITHHTPHITSHTHQISLQGSIGVMTAGEI